MLERRGHSVVLAVTGREAVAALEREPFDLVLMDVEMPEMDGLEATAAIRERERKTGGRIPVIAMTAHAMKGDRERFLEAGMDGYIAKPIDIEQLYEAVEKVAPGAGETSTGDDGEPQEERALDPEEAMRRAGGEVDVLRELVGVFFEECPMLTEVIRQSIASGNASELKRAAHTLKASVLALAARPAAEAALRIETMAQKGSLDKAREAWPALKEEIDRLLPALAELVGLDATHFRGENTGD
jgi:CheY-like chemotaxis protein